MPDFETPHNDLERAIAAVADAGEDADGSARRDVLVAMAQTTLTVLLPPRDDAGTPPAEPQPLFVSDGANLEQPMLAVFSSRERAEAFRGEESVAETQDIAGAQMFMGVPEGSGVMLNPNQKLNFRILPELAKVLREDVQASVERLSRQAPAADGHA